MNQLLLQIRKAQGKFTTVVDFSERLNRIQFFRNMVSLLFLFALTGIVQAATIEIHEGDSFETAAESLNPGDTLIVHQGTYADNGKISIAVRGMPENPILIKGADGEARPLITRLSTSTVQNTINIKGAAYLTVKGLEIMSNGGDGINLYSDPSFITLEDLHIHDVDVGINFRSSMNNITVRRNHIHNTGKDGGTGEGMYVGCNYATCTVRDSLIEGNWIHNTLGASQGDGIEIKAGSHSNTVRDNVIHDTRYPCILIYGTGGNPRNIVEGNAVWNCGDSGIQAAADAVIRNNLILNSPENGFNSQDHQGVTPDNLEFIHNTVVGGSPCLRLSNWSNKSGMVFANNAVYCESGNFKVSGLDGVTVTGNVVYPSTSQIPGNGYTTGRSVSSDFSDASNLNVYPSQGSPLIDTGNISYSIAVDFNGTSRSGNPDAGAYAWTSTVNPGWTVATGFKGNTVIDTISPAPPKNLRKK